MVKNTEKSSYKVRTVLGAETKFKGKLRFQDSLQINGHLEGSIESPGLLIVENGAVVIADIRVGTLVVSGKVEGDVHADETLEILGSGSIDGNIHSPNLVVEDGTQLHGRVEMLKDYAAMDVFAMPLDQLKKNITRVK